MVACLRALGLVGTIDDRETVKEHLASESGAVAASAALAYLSLSPNSIRATKDIVREPSEQRVWIATAAALNRKDKHVWLVLEPLLRNENEDIRRIVSYFAVQMLTLKELKAVLSNYQRSTPYYYNVIVLLDRAIYAPAAFRFQLLDEERGYLRKWEVAGIQMPLVKGARGRGRGS